MVVSVEFCCKIFRFWVLIHRADRSRSPLQPRRPTPPVVAPVLVLPPVVAPAPAIVFPLIPLERFQCPNFALNRDFPYGDLCQYDHGYQFPDEGLLELLYIPRPQNPPQPPRETSNYHPSPPIMS
ncbi:hypothetical protein DAPPUDRAFT_317799 [Daphnia pulex]|uniref:C3H1-type domain-containing protein n=1 Tax=Daphnia pulex TaxID=6669 RepID=E9GH08_DAPPU|nr:hypothetical protein DAPPUDRAFT_317799 [Daphnia pulex]|eukprot:EFX81270.1 hypothetical protein DAPPUDRAFT_317799 [Daphnia pulex]